MSRIPLSLLARMSSSGAMAAGVSMAITEHGLALPAQRLIAEKCRISPATLSRRLQHRSLDDLMILIVDARDRTLPPSYLPTAHHWLPADDAELSDARVWMACEQVALSSPQVGDAVREVWRRQRTGLTAFLGREGPGVHAGVPVDALQALLVGLTTRRVLDPEFDHQRAVDLFVAAIDSWARADGIG